MADNFRSVGAFKAWVWSYVPVVGGASAWSTIVFLMVMHFVASCVEQFAQSQASYEHNKELMQVLDILRTHPGSQHGLYSRETLFKRAATD